MLASNIKTNFLNEVSKPCKSQMVLAWQRDPFRSSELVAECNKCFTKWLEYGCLIVVYKGNKWKFYMNKRPSGKQFRHYLELVVNEYHNPTLEFVQ